ncbi:polyprotein [Bacillus toyonensis]|uniref:Polyprotein n=1 Tax=Bacillus toyonensis TaxID=155322 RepID=A0AB36SV07_9BACI|nr:polyprotein [Bacillus toyonensis]MED2615685.1 polyprotein [Bacillus toyonensis]MED2842624.1 polyprotein [Bacillus toyonensis]PEE01239.1 polyprotein [Bacillus toyonensis]PEN58607.1 polyprotein [Bacillus toyonensis]PEO26152.1 polyprotein [Bacillus toyonensis]
MFKWFKKWVNWHDNLDQAQAAIEFYIGDDRVVLIGADAMNFIANFNKKYKTLYVENKLTGMNIRFRVFHASSYKRTTYKVSTGEVGN